MPLDLFEQNTKQWLCTTASQIFFMQLGFLCYEVGFVKPVWTQSVILKNIEDTFVGVLTFLCFGYTLSASPDSFYGIISVPTNPLLIGIGAEYHDKILISAFFASTCATIISGAVLERMKNKAYISWCLLVILVNYSFVSHWVWHKDGWLNKLGFVDGAGAVVVHSTAGTAALVSVWRLGPRKESLDNEGKLLPIEHAARPIINAIGAMFLWYGWFAFNVSSPIAFSKGIDDAIGTTALVTVISPISASCAAFLWMKLGFVPLTFEHLLNCLLCGLVSVTGMCHTCSPLEAAIIGAFSSILYFSMSHFTRETWKLDDPLQVIPIHLFGGIFSCMVEGIIANDTYGTPGLIHGKGTTASFTHFGVQILGVFVIIVFNLVISYGLWEIILKRIIFRKTTIRVSILDIYLGTRLFDQNYDAALHEVLNCESNSAKKYLFEFHEFVSDRYAGEQLDFLICVKIFEKYLNCEYIKFDAEISAKHIIKIINMYIDDNGEQCINISGTQRSILRKIRKRLLLDLKQNKLRKQSLSSKKSQNENESENDKDLPVINDKDLSNTNTINTNTNGTTSTSLLGYSTGFYKSGMEICKENVFNAVFQSVWKIVIPHFTMFLRKDFEESKKYKYDMKIPFDVQSDWLILWHKQICKKNSKIKSIVDKIPQYNDQSGTELLPIGGGGGRTQIINNFNDEKHGIKEEVELQKNERDDNAIVFVDENKREIEKNNSTVVVIE